MSPEVITETIAGVTAFAEILSAALDWRRYLRERYESTPKWRDGQQQMQQQQMQQQQNPLNEHDQAVHDVAVIDEEILVVMLMNISRVKKRLVDALADPANTSQAKDAEVQAASSAICSELRRIRALNRNELPPGPLEHLWQSHACA